MQIAALLIAVVALAIAIAAFVRTGGIQDVRRTADAARDRTADILDRFEELVRSKDKQTQGKEDREKSETGDQG
jgi:hypothetical protein